HLAGPRPDVRRERRLARALDLGSADRLALQLLEQHGRPGDEARRAVAALEGEVLDEGALDRRQRHDVALLVALGMALDGAHALAGEEVGAGDARTDFAVAAVRLLEHHRAGMAGALAAAHARA